MGPDELSRLRKIIETQQLINAATLDGDDIMRVVAESAQAITGATGAVVELAEADEMVYRAATGSAAPFLGMRLQMTGSLSGLCVLSGEVLRCDDTDDDPRVDQDACRRVGLRSMIVVPLLHTGRALGVLKVISERPASFGDHDIQTLQTLAGFIAASLMNASAYQDEARRAMHDSLTGLPNRALLADRLGQALRHAHRTEQVVAVVYLDLDGFKPVNDRYGHPAGDQLLCAVADELTCSLRASDTVARVGGDEFVMVCENADATSEGAITDRVCDAVARAVGSLPFEAEVTASVGVAWSDAHASTEDLLAAADAAMYSAKRVSRPD